MWLLLLVLGWLALEVYSIVWAADLFGSGWMALWATLVTTLCGITIVGRAQHALSPAELMRGTMSGQNPIKALMRALIPMIAGVLMILPGFAGDVVALLLLFPLTRPLMTLVFGGLLMFGLKRLAAKGRFQGAALISAMQGMQGMGGANFGAQFGADESHRHHAPRNRQRSDIVDAEFEVMDRAKLPPKR